MTGRTLADLELEVERLRSEHEEFRSRVREVARKYAEEHDLCDIVEQALVEAGVGPDYQTVDVTLTADITVTLRVDKDAWRRMDGLDREDWLRDNLTFEFDATCADAAVGSIYEDMEDPVDVSWDIETFHTPVDLRVNVNAPVLDLKRMERPAPPGFVARYAGPNGQVLHYVEKATLETYQYPGSVCGDTYQLRMDWLETTKRATDRVCKRCERAFAHAR